MECFKLLKKNYDDSNNEWPVLILVSYTAKICKSIFTYFQQKKKIYIYNLLENHKQSSNISLVLSLSLKQEKKGFYGERKIISHLMKQIRQINYRK